MENVMVKLWFKSSCLIKYLNYTCKSICTAYQTFHINFFTCEFLSTLFKVKSFFQLKCLTFCRSAIRILDFQVGFEYFLKQTTYQTYVQLRCSLN